MDGTTATGAVRAQVIPNPNARLLDQVREVLRVRHYSLRTEQAYIAWIKRFIFFHHKRHPRELGTPDIEAFLTDLAVRQRVSSSTQMQAFNALIFLYRQVLRLELAPFTRAAPVRRPVRLPTVLTRAVLRCCRMTFTTR